MASGIAEHHEARRREVRYLQKAWVQQKNAVSTALVYPGGTAGAPPPTGPNCLVVAYIFAEKHPRRRSAPYQREILDPPLYCQGLIRLNFAFEVVSFVVCRYQQLHGVNSIH